MREYTSISVPKPMMKEVERFVEKSELYRSQAEFVTDAIRARLEELKK